MKYIQGVIMEMVNITAVILCIFGCVGYGIALILSGRHEIQICHSMHLNFLHIKSLLLVNRDVLECACMKLGGKNEEVNNFFLETGKLAKENYVADFKQIWKSQVKKYWASKIACKELYSLLLAFPEYICECDMEMLENSLNRYLYQWEKLMEREYTKRKENEKLVFTISLFCGLLVTILFI